MRKKTAFLRLSFLLIYMLAFSAQIRSLPIHDEYTQALRLGQKKQAEALARLKRIIEKEAGFDRAYAKIVALSKELDELENALTYFQKLAKENPAPGYAYYALGLIYQEKKEYEQAIEYFKQSAALGPKFAGLFTNLVEAYRELKKLDQAETYLAGLIKENPTSAAACYGLGYVYQIQMRWEQAIRFFDRALSLDSNLLDGYLAKGAIYLLTGRTQLALEILERGEQLARQGEWNDLESEAKFKENLGQAYDKMGNHLKALQLYQQALQLYKTLGDLDGEAEAVNWIGKVYTRLGDYQKALEHCQRGLATSQTSGHRKQQAEALKGIALVYYCLGRYQLAIEQDQLALALYQALGDRQGEATMLGNMAIAYADLGDYPRALDYTQRAATIYEQINDRANQLIAIGNMGTIYEDVGDYQNALRCYKESLAIARAVGDRSGQGVLFRLLGSIYSKLADHQKALQHYKNGLVILQEVGAHDQQAITLNKLGLLYTQMREYAKAIDCLDTALKLAKSTGLSVAIWQGHAGLGEAFEKQGQFDRALEHYQSAIEVIEDVRNRLSLAEQKSGFLENKIEVYEKLCQLLIHRQKRSPEKDYPRLAFYYAEKSKAQVLLDLLPQSQLITKLKMVSEQFRQNLARIERDLDDKRRKLIQKQAELNGKTIKSKQLIALTKEHTEDLQTDIDKLEAEKIKLFNQTKEKFPGYGKLYDPEVLPVEAIQREILQSGEVLVEYMVGENETLAFIISRNGFAYEQIPLGRKALRQTLKSLGGVFSRIEDSPRRIEAGESGASGTRDPADIQLDKANELYRLIFTPVEKYLTAGNRLIIVPDDVLGFVPFEMLVMAVGGPQSHYRSTYLIERYPISYVYSASLLRAKGPKPPKPEIDFLAFANSEPSPQSGLRQLPYSEREVRQLARIFRCSKTFSKSDSTKERFKELAARARIIHLAAHQVVEKANPLHSRIVFAAGPRGEDGLLYTYEVLDLNLNADLVVLSACDTAYGKLRRGEGLESISRAFLRAGAPALVATLWMVTDSESTVRLMTKFHRKLAEGIDKREALRQAKLELIRQGEENPFYWAPFILIGDSSPVEVSKSSWWINLANLEPIRIAWLAAVFSSGLLIFSLYKLNRQKRAVRPGESVLRRIRPASWRIQ